MKKITRNTFCKALLAGCAGLALAACGAGSEPVSSGNEPAASGTAPGSAEPLLAPEDYPRVDGSTACIPLMAAMRHELTGEDLAEVQSAISVSTTGYAWEKLAVYYDPETPEYYPELLVVYEAPEYIQQEIADAGTELEITPVGRDALVFMVNEQNPVQSLTCQQLVDIYTGKITNWSQVGGEDSPILAFQRSEDSGSQTLFKKLVMQDVEPMTAPTELAPGAMDELVDSLAQYNNQGNALGFSVYYYIDRMYAQPGLRLLKVEGVLPANDTIGDESYPYCNEFYAVVRADTPADSPARTAYNWLCGPEGAACVRSAGYVAVQGNA